MRMNKYLEEWRCKRCKVREILVGSFGNRVEPLPLSETEARVKQERIDEMFIRSWNCNLIKFTY